MPEAKVAVGDIGVCECLYHSFKWRIIGYLDSEIHDAESDVEGIKDDIKLGEIEPDQMFLGTRTTYRQYMEFFEAKIKKMEALLEQVKSIPDCKYGIKAI